MFEDNKLHFTCQWRIFSGEGNLCAGGGFSFLKEIPFWCEALSNMPKKCMLQGIPFAGNVLSFQQLWTEILTKGMSV